MEEFIINPSLPELEEFIEVNPAQLATGDGLTVAQPQTRSQDPIMAILQELKANMQSMDERVNKLSTKVDQTVNSTEVQSTNALTQNTSPCEVQNSILPTPLAYNATTEAGPEPPRDPEQWANSDPNTDFPDYSLQLSFRDSDDEQDSEAAATGTKLFLVSQKTEVFLSNCFTTAMPNQVRRQWKAKYGAPRTAVTACLNMDKSSSPDCLHRQRPRTNNWRGPKL